MHKRYVMPAVAMMLALSGCSSISEEECRLGDWYQMGLADGQKGKKNYSAIYSEECAEYGVTVDLKSYQEGRREGLTSYCTYENGTLVGQSNASYENVCPADLARDFLSGYTPYHNLAQAQSRLSSAESSVNNYKARLEEDTLSSDDRKTFKAELKSAKSRMERAEFDVNRFEYELAVHKIDREIGQIHNQLISDKLPQTQKTALNQRLASLNNQRKYYETLSTTENTIQNIKNIADLF